MILLRAIPQVQEARDLYAAALPAAQQTLGPEDPDTLTVRANLAGWTARAARDAAAGRDQYAALLPIQERVLGPKHPSTMNTKARLRDWAQNTGWRKWLGV